MTSSLSLYMLSDEEFLAIVKDNLDAEGWVTTLELADAIGLPPDDEYRLSPVGSRCSWMARYGVISRDTEKPRPARWTLTGRGIVILEAAFSPTEQKVLDGLKGEKLWRLARTVTSQYSGADDVTANMVRRSFGRASYQRRYR
jgi:hypothetical protein